jgi:hypothetical protein
MLGVLSRGSGCLRAGRDSAQYPVSSLYGHRERPRRRRVCRCRRPSRRCAAALYPVLSRASERFCVCVCVLAWERGRCHQIPVVGDQVVSLLLFAANHCCDARAACAAVVIIYSEWRASRPGQARLGAPGLPGLSAPPGLVPPPPGPGGARVRASPLLEKTTSGSIVPAGLAPAGVAQPHPAAEGTTSNTPPLVYN